MKNIVVFIFLIIFVLPLFSDQTATTKDGRKVLLRDDGTWKYIKEVHKQLDGWTNTPYGSFKVERFWEETSGSYNVTYTTVSYINDSIKTFDERITIRATIYDANENMIDTNTRSFFSNEYGIMGPGFKGIVKIPIECAIGHAQTVSVTIDIAR